MSKVIIVNDSSHRRKLALSVALLNLGVAMAEEREVDEYVITIPESISRERDVILKPHKTYLNLVKKDRYQS